MADGSWYIDEYDPTLVRWHDGTDWTGYVLVRADWDDAGEAPPPPDELVWDAPRAGPLRFVVGTAAVVLLVCVGTLVLFGDGGSDDPARGSTVGRSSQDDDRSTADLDRPVDLGVGRDVLGDGTTAGESSDATVGDADEPVARRSGSGTTAPATSPTVRRTETRSNTHTNPGSQTVIGPRDETNVGNSSATTISASYTPPPSTAPPTTVADTTPTTAAPATTTPTTEATTTGGATDG